MIRNIVGGLLVMACVVATAAQAKPGAKNPVLVLETARGTIEIELFRQDAPKSVEYIITLVNKNFYRGQRFHRSERTLVQIGDPNSRNVTRRNLWGQTGATPTVGLLEASKRLSHTRGAVGLAHAGRPEAASSQFYIMKTASPSLDGQYTIIGRVISGMAVVDAIKFEDVLKLATIREPK
ncbi:MAG: peptidylprolyl isomerase [Acidimicrobiia bacterium]|nr:peptidylprolyl isomerase [Acidimicrobiia bacterium]